MYKTTSVTDLRHNLSDAIDSLGKDEALLVVRHSKSAAYLVSPEIFEGLLERLEDLVDIRDMEATVHDYHQGEAIDGEEVFDRLGL
jgi:PHD/YefM family antitoxin component YafN of YafNO toxin-antitoxin module